MSTTQHQLAEDVFHTIAGTIAPLHQVRLAELVALCAGSKGQAAYLIVAMLSKPGRIPAVFATLLDLTQEDALARAFAAYYYEELRPAITAKVEARLLRATMP